MSAGTLWPQGLQPCDPLMHLPGRALSQCLLPLVCLGMQLHCTTAGHMCACYAETMSHTAAAVPMARRRTRATRRATARARASLTACRWWRMWRSRLRRRRWLRPTSLPASSAGGSEGPTDACSSAGQPLLKPHALPSGLLWECDWGPLEAAMLLMRPLL